ncbi:dihydroorotase [Candidatus Tenderia electrophaga]|jgi:dihydroorotase|uniref:Dihydroorotase n=1 Tax=Candidatus Tenderia electrophaga TaxID=1748243 RepID=A0A0S2T9Q7_9GAMM|nr:dihydroorotase [Candidatus Tenderia electrophaga]
MRILIKNGRVIDPANRLDRVTNVYIAGGRIEAVADSLEGFEAERTIDAQGRLVLPGLVDLAARLREPGFEHKGTIASETRAAAAAGITSLVTPPDTDPVIDTPAVAKLIRKTAQLAGYCHVYSIGAATQKLGGEHISEMGALKAAGCVGVGNALTPFKNPLVEKRVMEYAATFDLTLFLFSEDPSLRHNGCVHEGAISTRLGLPGIPEAAETVAVARNLALVADTGVRAHFSQISTAKALQMIARAQYDGLPVSVDVAAHHLFLTDMDIGEFDSQCHVRPPLRHQRDLQGLREGVRKGTVGVICSDHQPHEADAKLRPFRETASGISGLETLLPLTLRLAEENRMELLDAIARVTTAPAKIIGIEAGNLSPGASADVTVVDPEQYWRVTPANLLSRGHNTPFRDWDMKGRVSHTLLAGELVFSRT